jgi:hypothetical protein
MAVFRFLSAFLLLAGLTVPVLAEKQIEFVLPSDNIGGIYTPKGGGTDAYQPVDGGPELSCDRVAPNYARIILGPSGRGKIYKQVGDASCCSAEPVLSYGKTWKAGPFTCQASSKGLKCQRGKNGFVMSRSRLEVY